MVGCFSLQADRRIATLKPNLLPCQAWVVVRLALAVEEPAAVMFAMAFANAAVVHCVEQLLLSSVRSSSAATAAVVSAGEALAAAAEVEHAAAFAAPLAADQRGLAARPAAHDGVEALHATAPGPVGTIAVAPDVR